MTIEQAIERAKRLQRERQSHNPAVAQLDATATVVSPVTTAATAAPSRVVERGLRAVEQSADLPSFPILKCDPEICERERILLAADMGSRDHAAAVAAYKMLRTRVLQRLRASSWSKLAITSPGPNEGKSNTALNLALSIARERNNDVFLIDLDMRNPSICNYLGVQPEHEIVDFFNGSLTPRDLFFRIEGEDLTVAAGVRSMENSSELLATGRLEELLHYITSITPRALVIIDLPPLLNTDDALVVLPAIDATFLVVAEGKTRRDGLGQALEVLADFTVGGIAINQTQESIAGGYYGI